MSSSWAGGRDERVLEIASGHVRPASRGTPGGRGGRLVLGGVAW